MKIYFVSGDKKGFQISKKRVTDMGKIFNLQWIELIGLKKKFGLLNCIYIGDGIFEVHLDMKKYYTQ